MNWNEYFIRMAELVSHKSKDRSVKVGVVLVGPDNEIRASGFNGFPRGVNDLIDVRHKRPDKYEWTEHAERNAIYNAARVGVQTKGCTMYFNYDPTRFVCTPCARGIIQAGIVSCIGPNRKIKSIPNLAGTWRDNVYIGVTMLEERGV